MEEVINKVLELAKESLQKKTTPPRYRMPFRQEDLAPLLANAYSQEVSSRGGSFSPDDSVTLSNVRKVAGWLSSSEAKPMLLLFGGIGNGKTTMARAVIRMSAALASSMESIADGMQDRKQAERYWLLSRKIRVPALYTAQDLASLAQTDQQSFAAIGTRNFLIIDDLGCEPAVVKNWGTEVTPITDIIYKRYDGMMPTMVTTNLTKADIRKVYGGRVADRFNETFETIGYNGESYRR